MRTILGDRIPRRYHLVWVEDERAVKIMVHKDCLKSVVPIRANSPIVRFVSEHHEIYELFDSFSGDLSSDFFGFNRIILKTGEIGDYVVFTVPIPEIKKNLDLSCEECEGSGKRDGGEDECIRCDGTGKKYVLQWRTGYLTTASLGILFELALNYAPDTEAREYQHIILSMRSEYGQHGSSLHGYFGIDFSRYVHSEPFELHNVILKETVRAMKTAYGKMLGPNRYNEYSIRAEVRQGYLSLECPGDACAIHHTGHGYDHGRGQEFTCHNVDSPSQSLTLFAGLASIAGQIDSSLSKK